MVARLREKITHHHRAVIPTYERWLQAVFGKQLAEEAALDARIAELEDLAAEVAALKFWSDCSEREAYEQIQRARKKQRPEASQEAPPEEDADSGFSDEERIFREFLRQSLGEDPDDIPRKQYRQFFQEFQEATGRSADSQRYPPQSGRPQRRSKVSSQIKELYRILVRKLHPDSGADYDGEAERLWHDLQEAYKDHDLERMEILLALTEIHDGTDAPRTGIFHIRKVTAGFMRSARDLQAQLRKLALDPAARFAAARDREAFTRQFRAKLSRRLASARSHLAKLEALVASWTQPRKRRSPTRKKQTSAPGQQQFQFPDS